MTFVIGFFVMYLSGIELRSAAGAYARVSAAGCTLPRLTTEGWETAVFLAVQIVWCYDICHRVFRYVPKRNRVA